MIQRVQFSTQISGYTKMKKILALILIFSLLALICSCGGGNDDGNLPKPPNDDGGNMPEAGEGNGEGGEENPGLQNPPSTGEGEGSQPGDEDLPSDGDTPTTDGEGNTPEGEAPGTSGDTNEDDGSNSEQVTPPLDSGDDEGLWTDNKK